MICRGKQLNQTSPNGPRAHSHSNLPQYSVLTRSLLQQSSLPLSSVFCPLAMPYSVTAESFPKSVSPLSCPGHTHAYTRPHMQVACATQLYSRRISTSLFTFQRNSNLNPCRADKTPPSVYFPYLVDRRVYRGGFFRRKERNRDQSGHFPCVPPTKSTLRKGPRRRWSSVDVGGGLHRQPRTKKYCGTPIGDPQRCSNLESERLWLSGLFKIPPNILRSRPIP